MARILLIVPFLFWLVWSSSQSTPPSPSAPVVMVFLGGYAVLIVAMCAWGKSLTRRAIPFGGRFVAALFASRVIIAAWFAVGLFYGAGWGEFVLVSTAPAGRLGLMLPGTLLAVAPVVLAWMGLWLAQYPVDRAARESGMFHALDNGLPVHLPPSFWRFALANLRLQVLFTVVPIALILLVRDVLHLVATQWLSLPVTGDLRESVIMLASALMVFVPAPLILKRVLHTRRFPDSPTRDRLVAVAQRIGLRYREILLWDTDGNVANAAVMGVVPAFRYILLSDLLVESMNDDQIEAVFAHEAGHVAHRHMTWYVVVVLILTVLTSLPGDLLARRMAQWNASSWVRDAVDIGLQLAGIAAFLLLFGWISRRFERQADVYAARTVESRDTVGEYGAAVFNSALRRVAVINNMPIEPRRRDAGTLPERLAGAADQLGAAAGNWLHGSIGARMRFLSELAIDPARTLSFDRSMRNLLWTLLGALLISVAVAITML